MKRLILPLSLLFLTACATSRGFDRGALRESIQAGEAQITDAEIRKTLELQQQLKPPFKVAVYFQPLPAPLIPYGQTGREIGPSDFRWTGENENHFLELCAELRERGIVSDIFFLADSTITSTDLTGIRLAAARHGADAVFVLKGACQPDKYNNRWALLYPLLITTLFVPGTKVDGLFMTNGALWDVRNQYLYLTAEAESVVSKTMPAVWMNQIKILRTARDEALDQVAKEFIRGMKSLAGKNP